LKDDDDFVGDQAQGQPGGPSLADEIALEERATGDDRVVLGDAGQQGDAAFDRDQSGGGAAGDDLGGAGR
jgi:hypothetical protein